MVAGGRGGGEKQGRMGNDDLMSTVSFWGGENGLELDSDSCTTF